jgi:predicted enzyme related to lactoylglutathione lyase
MSASLSQIGQISVNVHDLERAVGFYKEVLGLPLLYQFPPKLAFFDAAGVRLMLSLPEDSQFDHPGSILYFKVADIQAAWSALREGGADLIREPQLIARMPDHDLWVASFKDPDGNTLALMSEVRSG